MVTALLETGELPITEPATSFKLEAPGGLINIEARVEGGRVMEVRMRSMPAFVGKVNITREGLFNNKDKAKSLLGPLLSFAVSWS